MKITRTNNAILIKLADHEYFAQDTAKSMDLGGKSTQIWIQVKEKE